jgi:hypothetical protein
MLGAPEANLLTSGVRMASVRVATLEFASTNPGEAATVRGDRPERATQHAGPRLDGVGEDSPEAPDRRPVAMETEVG